MKEVKTKSKTTKSRKLVPNKGILREWVKALRGRGYRQTDGCLIQRDGSNKPEYCCLGVLCRVGRLKESGGYFSNGKDRNNYTLPESFRKLVGISSSMETSLIHMNDSEGKTFKQIADKIEKHYSL